MNSQYEVIQSHISKFKDMLYTSLPAKVLKVNYSGDSIESVNVVPTIARTYSDGESRRRATIYSVPVIFPSGGGGLLSFPIAVDDTVLLIFNGDDNENFLDGSSEVAKSRRQFSYNDAIAIPCLYPFNKNLKPSKDKVELKYKGSSISIDSNGDIVIDNAANVTINNATTVRVVSNEINLESNTVNCTGNLNVTGAIVGGSVSTESGIDLEGHKHKEVRSGTSVSGVPV
jgi:hypothetical protein